jgi:hypothetical protein
VRGGRRRILSEDFSWGAEESDPELDTATLCFCILNFYIAIPLPFLYREADNEQTTDIIPPESSVPAASSRSSPR